MNYLNEIEALTALLGQDQYDDNSTNLDNQITPATLTANAPYKDNGRKIGQIQIEDPKAIWDTNEIPNEDEINDPTDTRKRPTFDILYKQDVMTEDIFLGLSDKDPSILQCNIMVVKVHFPNHQMKDLDLEVTSRRFIAESSTLKLSTYLPYKVDSDEGKAKWDSKTESLIVCLPILRDDW